MIRISPIFFMPLVAILSSCGNLEWPPKSTGMGYSGNEIGLENSARNTHRSPLTLSPQIKAKNFLESRIGANSREHIVANGELCAHPEGREEQEVESVTVSNACRKFCLIPAPVASATVNDTLVTRNTIRRMVILSPSTFMGVCAQPSLSAYHVLWLPFAL